MRQLVLMACASMLLSVGYAQYKMPDLSYEPIGKAEQTKLEVKFLGVVNPSIDADGVNWMKSVTKLQTYKHGSPDDLGQLKADLYEEKRQFMEESSSMEPSSVHQSGNDRLYTPVIGQNFDAHNTINSTPPDNTFAISDGGLVITSDNSTIEFYNQTGQALIGTLISHEEWFDDISPSLNITSGIFDPRALYDPVADRFIFVILHGSNSSTSKVLVCFSQTNNPSGNWNVYELNGNPFNVSSWTDYPHIGISAHDLFITGNLFTNTFGFDQAVVWQMDKQSGYDGLSSVPTVIHSSIPGGNIGAFSLVPASFGQDGEYGPGIYLVNSNSFSGSRLNLYEIDDRATNNPSLNYAANIVVDAYQAPADAPQPINNQDLATNDSRMQNAFYLNGFIHAVHQVNVQAGYSGIAYYRIPVNNPSNTESARFGETGVDNAFPSIASFGDETTDLDVMIGFLSVTSNTFPEMRAVGCDPFMQFSDDVLIRSGLGYVDTWISQGSERWGDYSTMQRKHNSTEPAVWFAGCYGASNNRWRSWISEINGSYTPPPIPVADFEGDTIEEYNPHYVTFTDLSTNDPDQWFWEFEGANPSFSTSQNPYVGYTDTGWFDVSLIATNQFGSDTILKEDYIHILNSDTIPPAGLNSADETVAQATVYPNPSTTYELVYIKIDNPETSHVDIRVVDMQGRLIRSMYSDVMRAGLHQLTFNKLAMSPGTYFVEIETDGKITQHEKVIVQ